MKSWTDNFIRYNKNSTVGRCPFCNSTEVEVEETEFGRRSVSFRCLQCGKGDHFDGLLKMDHAD